MRTYPYLGLLLPFLLACSVQDLPKGQAMYDISTDTPTSSGPAFDQCVLRYAFRNKARTFDPGGVEPQLKLACFDAWAKANGYLEFVKALPNEAAEINIVFADTLPKGIPNYTEFGLIGQTVSVLSRLVRQSDRSCTIYLLNTYDWNELTLRRVLLHQVGAALGLANSTRPESVMSAQLNALTRLDTSDVNSINRVYSEPCDQWTPAGVLPFDGHEVELGTSTTKRGYVLLNVGAGQNGFYEYAPETGWQSRTPYPNLSKPDTNPPYRLAFAVDTTLFVGDSYSNPWRKETSGLFYQYVPASNTSTDGWQPIANMPQLGYGTGRSFTLNKKGYLILAHLTDQSAEWIAATTYDAGKNEWQTPDKLRRFSATGDFGHFVLGATLPFVLNEQAYLISPVVSMASWHFTPLQATNWTKFSTFGGIADTKTGFSVRNAGYAVSGTATSKTVWQYNPAQGWKRIRDCPAKGKLAFSFVLNNRAYLGTDIGEFWVYRP